MGSIFEGGEARSECVIGSAMAHSPHASAILVERRPHTVESARSRLTAQHTCVVIFSSHYFVKAHRHKPLQKSRKPSTSYVFFNVLQPTGHKKRNVHFHSDSSVNASETE